MEVLMKGTEEGMYVLQNPFVAAWHGSQLVLVFALSILLTMVVMSDSVSACSISRFIILAQKPTVFPSN